MRRYDQGPIPAIQTSIPTGHVGDFLSLAGDVIQGVGSFVGSDQANRTNQRIALQQMAFQERMSSTAYQRAMQDMRLAGINPMLAYMQGGASSPGGASATVSDTIGPAISSARQGGKLRAEISMLKAQEMQAREQAFSARAQGQKAVAEGVNLQKEGDVGVDGLTNWQRRRNAELQLMASQSYSSTAQGRSAMAMMPARELSGAMAGMLTPMARFAGEGFDRIHGVARGAQRTADTVRQNIFDAGYRLFDRARSRRR